jgi:hypothetical protein
MEEVKCYWLSEIAKEEDKNARTIKNHPERYIPIRIESKRMKTRKENGEQKRDYTIKYIKRKDLKKFLDL